MKKIFRRSLSTKEINATINFFSKMKKLTIVVGLLMMVFSSGPQQYLDAKVYESETLGISEQLDTEELRKNYSTTMDKDFDPSKVRVDKELKELRSPSTKTYRKIDGTYEVAYYDDVVHFYQDGKLEQIDNSLEDLGNELENKDNIFKVKFPKKLDANKSIKLTLDKYQINWSVKGISQSDITYEENTLTPNNIKEINNVNQSVLYPNVLSNVDIEYILTGSSVKENIVLNEYIENFDMTFEYKLKDLEMIQDLDGNINFLNENNEVIFTFQELYMLDSDFNESFEIDFNLIETGNKTYEVTIKPSDEWLLNASYPVKIDPSVVLNSLDTNGIRDKYVFGSSGHNASTNYMKVGDYGSYKYRSYLEVDLAQVPDNAIVNYAHVKLELYSTKNNCTSTCQINIREVNEFTTFDSIKGENLTDVNSTIIDYEKTNQTVSNTYDYMFDVTKTVYDWHSDNDSRRVFEFRMDNETNSNYIWFGTEEYSYTVTPQVTIGYQYTSGIYPYLTSHSVPVGDAGSVYVTDYTGEVNLVRSDYSFMGLNLQMFYSEDFKENSIGFGAGWRTSYNIQMLNDGTGTGYYILDPSGSRSYYIPKNCEEIEEQGESLEGTCLLSEDGSRNRLDVRSSSLAYLYTTDGIKYTFEFSYLTKIENTKTNDYIEISYDGSDNIDFVVDHFGNKIDYSYSSGRLAKFTMYIMDSDLTTLNKVEEIILNQVYDSSHGNYELRDVTFKKDYDGDTSWNPSSTLDNKVYYTYWSDAKLRTAKSSHDTQVELTYYVSSERLANYELTDSGLNLGYVDITYTSGKTTYTDHEGDTVEYLFDFYGHTVNILDSYGNATFYQYMNQFSEDITEPNYFLNHKLISSSLPQKTTMNPINNHSFENPDSSIWYFNNGGTGANTYSYDSSSSALGDYSVKLTRNTSSAIKYYQYIVLDGGSYTLSGYVKNDGSSSGAYIDIVGESYLVGSVPTVPNDGEWHYVEVEFGVTSNNKTLTVELVNNTYGNVRFDNIQIIDGFRDTRPNLLDNPSFERNSTGWSLYGASRVYDNNETQDLKDSILGDYYIYMNGNTLSTYELKTTLSGNEVKTNSNYIIGNWVKGVVTPNKKTDNITDTRIYGMEVTQYNSGVLQKTDFFEYNADVEDWQYVVNSFQVGNNVDEIRIKVKFKGEGTVYLDGFQLYQEALGTSYEYDDYGNNSKIYSPISEGYTSFSVETGYKYLYGTVTSPDGLVTDYDYTTSGRIESVTQNNVTSSVQYDPVTKKIEKVTIGETAGKYFDNEVNYDNTGMYTTSTENEFGDILNFIMDYENGLISESKNSKNISTTYTYDKEGRLLTQQTDGFGGTYTYVDDKLTTVSINGYTYNLEYDSLDRITEVFVNKGTSNEIQLVDRVYDTETHNSTTYQYNRIYETTNTVGDKIKIDYDEEDRVSKVYFKKSTDSSYTLRFEYEYNQAGQLTIMTDHNNSTQFFYSYDLIGRVKKVTNSNGDKILYNYDNEGNLESRAYTFNGTSIQISYEHDNALAQYSKTTKGNLVKSYNYETTELKRLYEIKLEYSGSSIFRRDYEFFEGLEVTNGNTSTRVKSVSSVFYGQGSDIEETLTFDSNGNITNISKKVGSTTYNIDYEYDNLGQLTRTNNQEDNYTYEYEYYDNANTKSIKKYIYHSAGSNPTGDPLKEWIFTYRTDWKDQIDTEVYSEDGTEEYTATYNYSDTGNLDTVSYDNYANNNISLGWENRNLTSYTKGSQSITYKYNDSGYRTSKTVNGVTTTYYLEGSKVLYETDGTNNIYYSYDFDGSLLSITYNGTEYYYVFNALGDVSHLIDSSGNAVVEYRYDAFGNITYKTSSNLADANPYRYRGYRYDEETKLYYLQSRYYNPETGRFINADGMLKSSSTVLGHNMFAYTENNPIMKTDPTGYCYDYTDMDGDGNYGESNESGCGIGQGGSFGGSSGSSTGTSGTYSGTGSTSIGDIVDSSKIINDHFPTEINSGAGSNTSGSYSTLFYNNAGQYQVGYGQIYYSITAAQVAQINNMINYLESNNMTPKKGYKGGGLYKNSNGKLDTNYTYREYRLYKTPGSAERLVYQNETGIWLYTGNHYGTFITWE